MLLSLDEIDHYATKSLRIVARYAAGVCKCFAPPQSLSGLVRGTHNPGILVQKFMLVPYVKRHRTINQWGYSFAIRLVVVVQAEYGVSLAQYTVSCVYLPS